VKYQPGHSKNGCRQPHGELVKPKVALDVFREKVPTPAGKQGGNLPLSYKKKIPVISGWLWLRENQFSESFTGSGRGAANIDNIDIDRLFHEQHVSTSSGNTRLKGTQKLRQIAKARRFRTGQKKSVLADGLKSTGSAAWHEPQSKELEGLLLPTRQRARGTRPGIT